MARVALVVEEWLPTTWDDVSIKQPRYIASWERDDAQEWGPGWSELADAVTWARARAPAVRVALPRIAQERRGLSVGRDVVSGDEILLEESERVSAELPWPERLVRGYGGQVDIHEVSAGMDPTGEYSVSLIPSMPEISSPEDLYAYKGNALPKSPFRSLNDAVEAARLESPIVIVRLGAPVAAFFFSAGSEGLLGLQLPHLSERVV